MDKTTPTRGRSRDKDKDKLQAPDGKKESKRKMSGKGGRPGRRSSMQTVSPPPGAGTPASDGDTR